MISGTWWRYAYAAMYPDKVERLVVMDAPIPESIRGNEILLNPGVWHFNFHGPDAERLVAVGSASISTAYGMTLGRSGSTGRSHQKLLHSNLRAAGGMRAGFAQFTAFSQDAKDNKKSSRRRSCRCPCWLLGARSPLRIASRDHASRCDKRSGGRRCRFGALVNEERPAETVELIRNFLDASGRTGRTCV